MVVEQRIGRGWEGHPDSAVGLSRGHGIHHLPYRSAAELSSDFSTMNITDFHFSEGPGNQTVVLYQGREIATARSFPEACSLVLDAVTQGFLPQDRAESRI